MNKKQSNKPNAYLAVKGILKKNRKICTTVPMLDRVVDEFFNLLLGSNSAILCGSKVV